MPKGEPFLRWKAKVNSRLDGHDAELAEHSKDIAMLADICFRAKRRALKRTVKREKRPKPAKVKPKPRL